MEIAQTTLYTQAWKQSFSFIESTYNQNTWEKSSMRDITDALSITFKVINIDIWKRKKMYNFSILLAHATV